VYFLQVVGLVWGYIIQQFSQTVYILGAGFVLAAFVSKHGQFYCFHLLAQPRTETVMSEKNGLMKLLLFA
jgi:signal peptidase complex subunit 1